MGSRECTNGHAVWTSPATPLRRATRLFARHGGPDGKPIVGFVGRLAPEKHVERLRVLAQRDDLQLVIVGDGVDAAKLESALPSAVFTGALYGDELATAYASMDVFVHPGEHETFCQAVQEAMASGLPVIAPDAGGPRDLVAPYRTGLLLPVSEFEARLPRIRRPSDRRAAALLAGRPPQRAGPDVARDLRRAARPLRGRARGAAAQGGVISPALPRRPAATLPMS